MNRKTLVFFLLSIVPSVINLLLLPLYINYFTTQEYGIIALGNTFWASIMVLVGLSLEASLRVLQFKTSPAEAKRLFNSIFWFRFILILFWTLVFFFFGDEIFYAIYKQDYFFPYIYIIVITQMIGFLFSLFAIYIQNQMLQKKYFWIVIIPILLFSTSQVIGVLFYEVSLNDFLWIGFWARLSATVIMIYIYRSYFKFIIDKELIKKALVFALPLIPFVIFYTQENQLDKIFVSRYLSLEKLAIYSVLLTVFSLFNKVVNALENAVRPQLYNALEEDDKKLSSQFFSHFTLAGLALIAGIILLASPLEWWLNNPKYMIVNKYVWWMALVLIPFVFVRFYALIILYFRTPWILTIVSFLKLILLGMLFYFLLPAYGFYGIFIALSISQFINFLVFFRLNNYPININASILFLSLLLIISLITQIVWNIHFIFYIFVLILLFKIYSEFRLKVLNLFK